MSLTAGILLFAARYALGRRSGAAIDVEHAIAGNLHVFRDDHGCREALIRDIQECPDVGDRCDQESWLRTLGRLQAAGDQQEPSA